VVWMSKGAVEGAKFPETCGTVRTSFEAEAASTTLREEERTNAMQRRQSAVIFVVAVALVMGLCPGRANASSHSEAPGTTKDRLIDDTDLYAWVAGDAPN